jgi:hypothetical protein
MFDGAELTERDGEEGGKAKATCKRTEIRSRASGLLRLTILRPRDTLGCCATLAIQVHWALDTIIFMGGGGDTVCVPDAARRRTIASEQGRTCRGKQRMSRLQAIP